jgi:hypothetical protein
MTRVPTHHGDRRRRPAGLLATIAYTLARANINIVSAKINTRRAPEDVFLVDGARLHDEQRCCDSRLAVRAAPLALGERIILFCSRRAVGEEAV